MVKKVEVRKASIRVSIWASVVLAILSIFGVSVPVVPQIAQSVGVILEAVKQIDELEQGDITEMVEDDQESEETTEEETETIVAENAKVILEEK